MMVVAGEGEDSVFLFWLHCGLFRVLKHLQTSNKKEVKYEPIRISVCSTLPTKAVWDREIIRQKIYSATRAAAHEISRTD